MVSIVETKRAEPAQYGLLSSATTLIEDSSPHWIDEFDYMTPDCVADVTLTSICNTATVVTALERSSDSLYRTYVPFEVQTSFQCSSMGMKPEDIEKIARDSAEACLQKALEFELWTGTLAKEAAEDGSWDAPNRGEFPNRYLASENVTDVTPNPGTGVKSKYGLALLEKALADCGCGSRGTIHATRDVASALGIKGKNDVLETNLGNTVIAGVGYTGVGPGGVEAPAGSAWMYATGPITVRVGEVMVDQDKVFQSIDIKNNNVKYIVSQPAAITWNSCCHAAVLVDLSLDYS